LKIAVNSMTPGNTYEIEIMAVCMNTGNEIQLQQTTINFI